MHIKFIIIIMFSVDLEAEDERYELIDRYGRTRAEGDGCRRIGHVERGSSNDGERGVDDYGYLRVMLGVAGAESHRVMFKQVIHYFIERVLVL